MVVALSVGSRVSDWNNWRFGVSEEEERARNEGDSWSLLISVSLAILGHKIDPRFSYISFIKFKARRNIKILCSKSIICILFFFSIAEGKDAVLGFHSLAL